MTVLVTYVSVNQRGQANRDRKRVDGTVLTIGRGSQCEIHLPDPRVALAHARITITERGGALESDPGRLVQINGRQTASAILAVGDRIEVGPYAIEVEAPPEGIPLALTVTQVEAQSAKRALSLRRMMRRRGGMSKRRLSYLGMAAVLLICLLLPIVPDIVESRGAGMQESMVTHSVLKRVSDKFVQMWNPGPMSRSHQAFADDCRACHQFPFVQVQDLSCIACHKSIKEHVPMVQVNGPRGAQFRETRCAQCHLDHKGTQMAPRAQEQCTDCHTDVKSVAVEAKSENVTDFATNHPKFRLSMVDADKPTVITRVRQAPAPAAQPVEHSNLKFNHELHLDPNGVRDPEAKRDAAGMRDARGLRTVMKCENCHEPVEGGKLIAPVSMDKHCRQCHSLSFETKVSSRQVPHGSEKEVATTLNEFYARLVLGETAPGTTTPNELKRTRPGEVVTYEDRQRALAVADGKSKQALKELYETRDVCSTCHYITRKPDGTGYKVAPVKLTKVWMPQASFSHLKHATQPCASCHNVTNSTEAQDVAMPDIAKCRECHVGTRAVKNKVASDCATCHKFHAGGDYWHDANQRVILKQESR